MNNETFEELIEDITDEEYYYKPENVEELSIKLGTSIRDTLKYLVSCVVDGTNEEDATKLTNELLEVLESLKENCEEFITTYNYQITKLEIFREIEKEGKVEEIRNDMQEYSKFLCKVAHRAAEKEGKI